ncbi:Flp family type IVb pilin [Cupriavidus basilensis]|nr:Flp family type IVb pilin [Cupriavidus basilensis]MDF3883900.1 Flp family type IVb pilin [Cupriavidus basilensis]
MFKGIKHFVRDEDGATGVEYALLLTFVALVIIGFGAGMGNAITRTFAAVVAGMPAA